VQKVLLGFLCLAKEGAFYYKGWRVFVVITHSSRAD